jgi:hypothetical protein
VAGNLGFCGLDATRQPLSGEEIRPCWQPVEVVASPVGLFEAVEPAGPR